jgi:rhodanese-related sulfurtransferase
LDHSPRFLALVDDSKKRVSEISAQDVRDRLSKNVPTIVIDVREDREWDAGHIRGARHMGRGVLERDVEKAFPDPSTELILYCGGGFRSALSADSLRRMGYTRALSMAGGWRDWLAVGGPTEK